MYFIFTNGNNASIVIIGVGSSNGSDVGIFLVFLLFYYFFFWQWWDKEW